jgi:hypothetical protein
MKLGFFTTLRHFDDDDEVQEQVMTWFKGQAYMFVTAATGRQPNRSKMK